MCDYFPFHISDTKKSSHETNGPINNFKLRFNDT